MLGTTRRVPCNPTRTSRRGTQTLQYWDTLLISRASSAYTVFPWLYAARNQWDVCAALSITVVSSTRLATHRTCVRPLQDGGTHRRRRLRHAGRVCQRREASSHRCRRRRRRQLPQRNRRPKRGRCTFVEFISYATRVCRCTPQTNGARRIPTAGAMCILRGPIELARNNRIIATFPVQLRSAPRRLVCGDHCLTASRRGAKRKSEGIIALSFRMGCQLDWASRH